MLVGKDTGQKSTMLCQKGPSYTKKDTSCIKKIQARPKGTKLYKKRYKPYKKDTSCIKKIQAI